MSRITLNNIMIIILATIVAVVWMVFGYIFGITRQQPLPSPAVIYEVEEKIVLQTQLVVVTATPQEEVFRKFEYVSPTKTPEPEFTLDPNFVFPTQIILPTDIPTPTRVYRNLGNNPQFNPQRYYIKCGPSG